MTTPVAQTARLIHTGEVIARQGVSAASVDLLLLAHDARDLGVEPVLVDVMVDENAPPVVRTRAFSRVAAAMAALGSSGLQRVGSSSVDDEARRELAGTGQISA